MSRVRTSSWTPSRLPSVDPVRWSGLQLQLAGACWAMHDSVNAALGRCTLPCLYSGPRCQERLDLPVCSSPPGPHAERHNPEA